MNPELRAYMALARAESALARGVDVRYAVESAASALSVDPGKVALLVLEKRIECERWRAAHRPLDAELKAAPPSAKVKRQGGGNA